MDGQKFFTLLAAAFMWTCVVMDIFSTICAINADRYCLAAMAIGAGIICATCGVWYTRKFFKED